MREKTSMLILSSLASKFLLSLDEEKKHQKCILMIYLYIIIINKNKANLILNRWEQRGNDLKEEASNVAENSKKYRPILLPRFTRGKNNQSGPKNFLSVLFLMTNILLPQILLWQFDMIF